MRGPRRRRRGCGGAGSSSTRLASLLGVALVATGCAAGSSPESPPPVETPAPAPASTSSPATTPVSTPTSSPAEQTLTADVLEAGPLGHGSCVQRSYRVRPYDGQPELWIHFERCGGAAGPDFGNLHIGNTYRFTLRRGASENFGDDPMIVAAEPVDP